MFLFAACSISFGYVFSKGDDRLYGVGLVIAGFIFFVSSFICLRICLKDVLMRTFVEQQMNREAKGVMTLLSRKSDEGFYSRAARRKADV